MNSIPWDYDIFMLMLLVGMAITTCIIAKISIVLHAKKPCDVDEIAKSALKAISETEITTGLSHDTVFRKDGKIRANIQKKINTQYSQNEQEYLSYRKKYIYRLKDMIIDISSDTPKILNKDAKLAKIQLIEARNEYRNDLAHVLDCKNGAITPEEFFQGKKQQTGDCVGVYIIHNQTKDMFYVGQATRLYFRVNQHFTGHGNGDVYADYKYGDKFKIKLLKLTESGYDDLDKLEKDKIREYNAYEKGYNKTSGNGS